MTRVRGIHMSSIPDTLYMVEDPQYIHHFMANAPNIENTVDIVSGTIPGIVFTLNAFILSVRVLDRYAQANSVDQDQTVLEQSD